MELIKLLLMNSKYNRFSLSLLLVSILTLSACSNYQNDVRQTMSLAFYGTPDVVKSAAEVDKLPYASVYIKVEPNSRAFVLLAFVEPLPLFPSSTDATSPEFKWIARDGAMLATQFGRITRTAQLPAGNLVATTSDKADPLSLGLQLSSTPKSWHRKIDWQPGYHFGYSLDSRFEFVAEENIVVNEKTVSTLHFNEIVDVSELDVQYQNQFWIDPVSGVVIKSRQKLAPSLPYVEMTTLKPYSS